MGVLKEAYKEFFEATLFLLYMIVTYVIILLVLFLPAEIVILLDYFGILHQLPLVVDILIAIACIMLIPICFVTAEALYHKFWGEI